MAIERYKGGLLGGQEDREITNTVARRDGRECSAASLNFI
jgi:hypothetical protein